jgi:hypothetical protein
MRKDPEPDLTYSKPLTWRFSRTLTVLNTADFHAWNLVQISHGGEHAVHPTRTTSPVWSARGALLDGGCSLLLCAVEGTILKRSLLPQRH